MEGKSALIIGASGMVGGELLQAVLRSEDYAKVTILTRKPLEHKHPKLKQFVIDFDLLPQYKDHFKADHVYCCLGTTIKQAKSREAFRKVDLEYPLEAAKLAKGNLAAVFLMVTAMGADTASRIFYNQVKGKVEHAVNNLRLPSLIIFRPSFLLGERKEFRLGEKWAGTLSRLLFFIWKGPLHKYKPIEAAVVARAMVKAAKQAVPGTHIYESDRISSIGAITEK